MNRIIEDGSRLIVDGNNGWGGYGYPVVASSNCGGGLGLGLGLLGLAILGVGGACLLKPNDGARYQAAVLQGETKAQISCVNAGVSRLEGQFSQLFQNQLQAAQLSAAALGVINNQNTNQQKTDTGLAVNANIASSIRDALNSILLPGSVRATDVTPATA